MFGIFASTVIKLISYHKVLFKLLLLVVMWCKLDSVIMINYFSWKALILFYAISFSPHLLITPSISISYFLIRSLLLLKSSHMLSSFRAGGKPQVDHAPLQGLASIQRTQIHAPFSGLEAEHMSFVILVLLCEYLNTFPIPCFISLSFTEGLKLQCSNFTNHIWAH